MKYVDDKGKEMEIAYSTQVQEKLAKTLRDTLHWRRKMFHALNWIRWLMIIFIILAVFFFFYLDHRNAVTFLGQKIFCT